jgi:predicted O-methyltransferase YrrM
MKTNSALFSPEVQTVLERLHSLADSKDDDIRQQAHNACADWKSVSIEQRAAMLRDVLMPISRDTGRFLYGVARSISAKNIVEFGTSYGVSTIYFATAVKDNGDGLITGSELEESKVVKATNHLKEAGLGQFVRIRQGDARQTLRNFDNSIDLLFLDGWKELYLELLKMLSLNLRSGSVVLADDLDIAPKQLAPYLDYIRNPVNGFISVMLPFGDGIEYSVKL